MRYNYSLVVLYVRDRLRISLLEKIQHNQDKQQGERHAGVKLGTLYDIIAQPGVCLGCVGGFMVYQDVGSIINTNWIEDTLCATRWKRFSSPRCGLVLDHYV